MENDKLPTLRLIKIVLTAGKGRSIGEIAGNQFFPAILASWELLPKLRFMRAETSLTLCINPPGQSDFKPVSFARYDEQEAIAPIAVDAGADGDRFKTGAGWPYKAPLDLNSLDARSLRGLMELAREPSTLQAGTEEIVERAFRAGWLDQSTSKRAVWENVRAKCLDAGIKPPAYTRVAKRIDCLFSREVLRFHPLTRDTYAQNSGHSVTQ